MPHPNRLPLAHDLPPELAGLDSRNLWSIFYGISAIPHPSHEESRLAAAVLERAHALGIEAAADQAGNVILKQPASPGREGAPTLVLQAHLDMVPQVEAGHAHDFKKDPLRLRLLPDDPAWLGAGGTSLGADNGIGVAAALALLEEADLEHGALEILLTVNEEDGMSGARGIEAGALKGSLLLNLDGEAEDELCVGCSGGYRFKLRHESRLEAAKPDDSAYRVSVSGLLGGHSAADIDRGRGNAVLSLAAILAEPALSLKTLRLAEMSGGSAANVIPRDAEAAILVSEAEAQVFERLARERADLIAAALGSADPGFSCRVERIETPRDAMSEGESRAFLLRLRDAPNGVRFKSRDFPGLPALSSNLGSLAWKPAESGRAVSEAVVLVRGARDADKEACAAKMKQFFEEGGFATEYLASYPAWTPRLDSPLLAAAKELYDSCYAREPKIMATHGGLECGLFKAAYPHWDMLSLGPDIRYPHSPSEAVNIASVDRFWRYLKALVTGLSRI